MGKNRYKLLLVLSILVITILACGGSGTDSSEPALSNCEKAMKAAAEVSDIQDTVEDIDPAIRACESMDEFKAASFKFPKALDGVDEQIFVTNRCMYNPSLNDTAICKAINK